MRAASSCSPRCGSASPAWRAPARPCSRPRSCITCVEGHALPALQGLGAGPHPPRAPRRTSPTTPCRASPMRSTRGADVQGAALAAHRPSRIGELRARHRIRARGGLAAGAGDALARHRRLSGRVAARPRAHRRRLPRLVAAHDRGEPQAGARRARRALAREPRRPRSGGTGRRDGGASARARRSRPTSRRCAPDPRRSRRRRPGAS